MLEIGILYLYLHLFVFAQQTNPLVVREEEYDVSSSSTKTNEMISSQGKLNVNFCFF